METQKTLFAIISCRHRPQWRDALRRTWLAQVPSDKADAFFFVGKGEEPLVDYEGVVELDCSDRYEHLPEKVRSICKWASERNYAYLLKTDEDTLLRPNDFLRSEYDRYEYSGRSNRPESPYPIPYGFGYVLSKKCMDIMSAQPLPGDGSWDDEKWCATTLFEHGIKMHDDRRYYLHHFPIDPPQPKRSLRAPKRPVMVTQFNMADGTFSYCVHTAMEMTEKLQEYHKLWDRFKETR